MKYSETDRRRWQWGAAGQRGAKKQLAVCWSRHAKLIKELILPKKSMHASIKACLVSCYTSQGVNIMGLVSEEEWRKRGLGVSVVRESRKQLVVVVLTSGPSVTLPVWVGPHQNIHLYLHFPFHPSPTPLCTSSATSLHASHVPP